MNKEHVIQLTKLRIKELYIYKLKSNFEGIKNYYRFFNNKIQCESEGIFTHYKKELKSLEHEDEYIKQQINDYYVEMHSDFKEAIIKNYQYSCITLIYSFLERSLLDLCMYIKDRRNINLNPSDLRDKGIIKAQIYLKKVCNIDFPNESNEWQTILKFNKIRNFIVHAEGDLNKSDSKHKLRKIISETNHIQLKDERYLEIEDKYVEEIISKIEIFVFKLYNDNCP